MATFLNESQESPLVAWGPALVMGAVVAIGGVALSVAGRQSGAESTVFVHHDVAAVYLLSAFPLASSAVLCVPAMPVARLLIVALLSLAVSVPLAFSGSSETGLGLDVRWSLGVVRAATALGLVLAILALARALQRGGVMAASPRVRVLVCGIGLLIVAIVPATYVHARCRHDLQTLGEFVDQSRLGEAQTCARQVMRLAPWANWRGRPIEIAARDIDRSVRDLEAQVAEPVPGSGGDDPLLQRGLQLAMLGRTADALAVLEPLFDSPVAAEARDLCGTMYESRSEWSTALRMHRQAKAEWLKGPATPRHRAGVLRATTRLAYCERKLGHYQQAEAAYREALEMSPSAEMHFLLARFYEDMQQSAKSRFHARRAMALAPERYHREGTQLIDSLIIGHFGCLSAQVAEWSAGRSGNQSATAGRVQQASPLARRGE